jgi:hypothetical protein
MDARIAGSRKPSIAATLEALSLPRSIGVDIAARQDQSEAMPGETIAMAQHGGEHGGA